MSTRTCHPSIVQGRMEYPISEYTRHPSATLPELPTSQSGNALKLNTLTQCKNLRERICRVKAYGRNYFGADVHGDIVAHSLAQKRGVFD